MTASSPDPRSVTRRSFMVGAVAAGALVAGGCTSDTSRSATATTVTGGNDRPDPGAAHRVVVVGAGLAGLTAALDLRDAGWDVVVLEARDRVGGRVHTLRGTEVGGPFSSGLHAEAGGESIDDNHDQLRAALRRFGLTTEARDPNRQTDGMVVYQGAPVALTTFVSGRGGAIGADYARARAELEKLAVASGVDPEHPEAARDAAALDRQSLSSFYDSLGLVPEARFLVEQADTSVYASDLTQVSLLFALQQAVVSAGVPDSAVETMRVAGGNDTLPTAMAAELGAAVVTGVPVQRIAETADGVAVTTVDRTWFGAHVVLAVPPPPLREVTFDPPLPPALAAAIEGLRLGPAVKVITEFPTPFWKDSGRSGFSIGDAQYRVSWSPTDSYAAESGLLSSFTTATHAVELAAMDEPARIARVQSQLAVPYPPPAGQSPTAAATMAWPNEPFTQGGYAAYAPGQMAAFWPALRTGTARLHLAGEHTEVLAGYMESAVRSGHRAATTIGRPT